MFNEILKRENLVKLLNPYDFADCIKIGKHKSPRYLSNDGIIGVRKDVGLRKRSFHLTE